MRVITKFLTTAALLLMGSSSVAHAGVLYGLTGSSRGGGPANLYRLNHNTGQATFVGSTRQSSMRGFTIDHTTGRAFASHTSLGGLWEISLATGIATQLSSGSGPRFREMVVDGNGDLYGYTSRREGFYDYFRIDKSTGQQTLINPNSPVSASLWSVSYSAVTDQLVFLDGSRLGIINSLDGRLASTRSLQGFSWRPWSAIDENGDIYHVDRFQSRGLYRLNRNGSSNYFNSFSGGTTRLGTHGQNFAGLAFNNFTPPPPNSGVVPEPTSFITLGALFTPLGLIRRRKT